MANETSNETKKLQNGIMRPAINRGTGPLDYLVPWVIELRVMGTTSIIQVRLEESMTVGRSGKKKEANPDIDLEAYNGYYMGVSRQHAALSAANSRVMVRDLGSSNGTFLNGGMLEPGRDYRLRHGDQLSFGQLALQVVFVLMPSSYEKYALPYTEVVIPPIGNGERVMIVEGDNRIASTMGNVLEAAGFTVTAIEGVTQALMQFDRYDPQMIITELMLADRNGLELVRAVRNQKTTRGLPIIVVSSVTGGYQMGQALEAGVDVFLTKPVGIDELLKSIGKVIPQITR